MRRSAKLSLLVGFLLPGSAFCRIVIPRASGVRSDHICAQMRTYAAAGERSKPQSRLGVFVRICAHLWSQGLSNFCKTVAVFLALTAVARAADTSYPIPTADGSNVTIRLSTPLNVSPRFGFFPVRIWIENRSNQNGQWDLRFHSGIRDRFPGTVDSSITIAVDALQNKETWYYVPLASAGVVVAPTVTSTSLSSTALSAFASGPTISGPVMYSISSSGTVLTATPGGGGGVITISGQPSSPAAQAAIASRAASMQAAGLITAAEAARMISTGTTTGTIVSTASPMTFAGPGGPTGAPARPPGPEPVAASLVDAAAKKLLGQTDLLRTPPSVKTTQTIVPVPDGTGFYSYSMVLIDQAGPANALPRPAPGSVPDELVVNVHQNETAGLVTRTITYMDPGELDRLNNTPQSVSKERAYADLMRYGFLRDQPHVTVGPMTASISLERGGGSPTILSHYAVAESGPRSLLPVPSAASLPPGVSVQIVPMAGATTNVLRYFFTGSATLQGQPKAASPSATAARSAATPSLPAAITSLLQSAPPPTMVGAMDPLNITGEIAGYAIPSTTEINLSGPLVNTALPTPPIAVIPRMEGQLRNQIVIATRGLPTISPVDPFIVPADWRVWSSFHAVVMRNRDFEDLDPARRAALREWVSMGGLLVLFPGRDDTVKASTENLGTGSVIKLATAINDTDSTYLVSKLQLNVLSLSLPPRDSMRFFSSSALAGFVTAGSVDSRVLATFLGIFGLLIGPVNLFLIARAKKRHRLFVTTPIMAICGAVGMIAIILHDDGFGGDGVRATVVSFVPGQPAAAVFQDQVARTGFLNSRDFRLDEKTVMVGIPIPEYDPSGRDSNLSRKDGIANGDWFRNRWRQAHHLREIVPTRARIEVVGQTPEGAPIVESTLTTELTEFIYVTADDRVWKAASVVPGRRIPLELTDLQLRPLISAGATRNLDALLNASSQREPGRWVAKGGPSDFAPIGTLPSVRWTEASIWYTGVALPPEPAPKKEGTG